MRTPPGPATTCPPAAPTLGCPQARLAQQREAGVLGDEGALKPRVKVANKKIRVKGARKEVGKVKAVPGSDPDAADETAPRDEL